MDTSALRSGSKRSFRDSDDDLVQQSRAHLILDPAAATSPQRRFEANPICGLGVLQFMTRRSTETLLEASPDLSRTMLLYFGLGIVGRLRAARRVGPLVGGEGDFWSPDNEDADDYIKFSRQTTSIIQERHGDLEGVYSALRDAAVDAVQGVKRLWVGGAQSPDSVFLKRFVLPDAPRVHNNTSCCEVVRVGDVDLVFLHCKQALLPQTEKWASSAPVQPVPSNVAFDDPRTASHRAAHFGHVSCLDVLLRAGLPGNLPSDKTRSTPAHYCAIRGDVESLELLLRHGIDVSAAVDGQGRTPAVVAEACGHHDCRQWFATCGVPPQAAAA